MINPRYRFLVNGIEVNPIYKDDLAKEYELETNQRFYRAKLSGKITFLGKDFDYLNNQPFDTEFLVDIQKTDDLGQTWDTDYYHGKFMKTDCQWDDDDKRCIVQPDAVDEYNDVLAGLDKEYDLIKIAPEIQPMLLQRRPLIQVYVPGDSVVSCFIGGTYWEQDADVVTDYQALEETYYFALCNLLKEINLTVTGFDASASGLYVGRMSIVNEGGVEKMSGTMRRSGDNTYYLSIEQERGTSWFDFTGLNVKLYRQLGGVLIFEWGIFGPNNYDQYDFDMTPVGGATGTAHGEMSTYRIYARYLLDVETIQGLNTYPLPADDIVENNRNYRRAIGFNIDISYISTNLSVEPTEWGRADNGQYFLPPFSIFGQQFFPIARSTWRYASIWFGFHVMDWIIEKSGRKTYLLRDTFPVASAIQKLLNQFAPGVTHEETPDYSEFFYNPNGNPITFQYFRLLISQKSNILVGDYDQPAQKAPTTLQQFTNMLRDCFRCFWFIDNGKFRIEHISWFRNGGSYSGGAQIGTDVTVLENIRNNKKWGFHSSAWEFDKVDLAERFQFSWMDDVTPSFEGEPMEVLSKYVTAGKIEDVTVSNFTPDVDFMLLNPANVSNDGFALFAAVNANSLVAPDDIFGGSEGTNGNTAPTYPIRPEVRGVAAIARFSASSDASGATGQVVFYNAGVVISTQGNFVLTQSQQPFAINVNIPANADAAGFVVSGYGFFQFYDLDIPSMYELPFVTRSVDGIDYIMQNGYMSWTTLQPNYYPYDLPARRVTINGQETFAFGIERKRKQQIEFPSISDPDPMKLIKTYLGDGQVDKISINLHSRMNKITLKYDTE